MTHPLITQLRFTRSEFQRALAGITEEEAQRRFEPINSMSWMVGHLAAQEQRYWLQAGQGRILLPELSAFNFGAPPCNPELAPMWAAWNTITTAVDPWLDTLTSEQFTTHMIANGETLYESIGSMLRRVTYHYWFHLGESQAIRQLLGHTNLPTFVGDIHDEAPYQPE